MLARCGGDAISAASIDCGVAPTPTFSPNACQFGSYEAIAACELGSSASVPVNAIRLDQLYACAFSTLSTYSGASPCAARSTSVAHSKATAMFCGVIATPVGADVGPAAANAVAARAASAARRTKTFRNPRIRANPSAPYRERGEPAHTGLRERRVMGGADKADGALPNHTGTAQGLLVARVHTPLVQVRAFTRVVRGARRPGRCTAEPRRGRGLVADERCACDVMRVRRCFDGV